MSQINIINKLTQYIIIIKIPTNSVFWKYFFSLINILCVVYEIFEDNEILSSKQAISYKCADVPLFTVLINWW